MRLFVDVDDTLILWSKELKGGLYATKYERNEAVARFVRIFRQTHPEGIVIVWSLGGQEYAAKHAREQIPGLYNECRAKYPAIPVPGDLFIDDDPLPSYRSAFIHPDALGGEE